MSESDRQPRPLRIFYLEDNPLIIFLTAELIEELGHVFAGSADSFVSLQEQYADIEIDAALVDIDLADGMTGPTAAAWLNQRGIPTIFVTGQDKIAAQHHDVSIAVLPKPIAVAELAEKLEFIRSRAAGG